MALHALVYSIGGDTLTHQKDDIEEIIKSLAHQTKHYVDEIKKRIEQIPIVINKTLISYFTTSINISHPIEQESLCLGSYHIRNTGNQLITNPSICIKLPEGSPFSFSGKYVYGQMKPNSNDTIIWERINDTKNKSEFWLKPIEQISIMPNDTISFSNFQISWPNHPSYSGIISGITYCDEVPEGIEVVNPISLSGMNNLLGDEHGYNE